LRTFQLVARVHHEAQLHVTGRIRDDRSELVEQLGLSDRVRFLGRYAQRDAPAIYQSADLLLHARVNDPCPNVVVEALASGLPVVYPASGGTVELVGDDAGVGVDADPDWERDTPADPEALAAAVEDVLGRLDAYRAAARSRAVERFDLRGWVDRHARVFESLVA
jgi:glycosyltransferase involved in cell wall biosynthesis